MTVEGGPVHHPYMTSDQVGRQTGRVGSPGQDRDLITYALLTTVATAAAVMSFAAWSGLAEQVGIHEQVGRVWLNWLLPISVDAYAMTATRVWLMVRSASDQTRQWAARNALGAILLSAAGNALFHLVTELDMTTWTCWWLFVVIVSSLPAFAFGLSVHLSVLVRKDKTRSTGLTDQSPAQTEPVQPTVQRPVQQTSLVLPTGTVTRPAQNTRPTRPAQARPATVTSLPSRAEDWDEWMSRLRREFPDSLPSQYAIRQLGANATKAKNLRSALERERAVQPEPADRSDDPEPAAQEA